MKILVTSGAGFVDSYVAEFYAKCEDDVVVFDNHSNTKILGKAEINAPCNRSYLEGGKK